MSAAAAMQQTPAVPPRPGRTTDKESSAGAMPQVPPRPAHKQLGRSISPNPDRFAPSPLNGGIKAAQNLAVKELVQDAVERTGSVPMPSVGEEGMEYRAVAQPDMQRSSSPEQTRTVAEDLKLHAPKPSLPAASAKQQVMAVTRTDSDRAASFGIGRPTSTADERTASRNSIKKRPSSSFSAHSDHHTDDEHGIPEIGQRVPMNPHLGDVQAPSPGPDGTKRHHGRKHSARGLPPGSYGLHGHGVAPQDRLDKAYYQKHPEALEREQHTPLHDRQNDFAMSSSDLNKLVRDTASRQAAKATAELRGTPAEEVAFQASEEYTSRISSTRPASAVPPPKGSPNPQAPHLDAEKPIHVDDARLPELYLCGAAEENIVSEGEQEYIAPILASDEVNKDPNAHLLQQPAIHPHPERRGSLLENEDPPSRPTSRPNIAGAGRFPHSPPEFGSTPLEDVEEYEPLFSEEAKEEKPKHDTADENEGRHHFPSKDIWEDAPSSVHYTATVSTPDVPEQKRRRSSTYLEDRPITPAQAFAQYQEQLAEKEASSRSNAFLSLSEDRPTWTGYQPHPKPERPALGRRFPSRDVWEDAPESQLHQAVVSGPPTHDKKPEIPIRPVKKASQSEPPAVPDRPRPRQGSGDDDAVQQRPPVSDKPKPHVPPRPTKSSSGDSKDGSFSKPKPPVPSRPVGNKIAALQAGFMSDLNKRLQLGPQAPKKEEADKGEEAAEEKEQAPLSDARKGRARGPQRRAPAKSPASAVAASSSLTPSPAANASAPTLTLSVPQTSWTVDPDDGDIAAGSETEATPVTETSAETSGAAILDKMQAPDGAHRAGLVEEPRATTNEPRDAEKPQQPGQRETPEGSAQEVTEKPERRAEEPAAEEKTVVANMAGESVLETTVKKEDGGDQIEPVEVHDVVKA